LLHRGLSNIAGIPLTYNEFLDSSDPVTKKFFRNRSKSSSNSHFTNVDAGQNRIANERVKIDYILTVLDREKLRGDKNANAFFPYHRSFIVHELKSFNEHVLTDSLRI